MTANADAASASSAKGGDARRESGERKRAPADDLSVIFLLFPLRKNAEAAVRVLGVNCTCAKKRKRQSVCVCVRILHPPPPLH